MKKKSVTKILLSVMVAFHGNCSDIVLRTGRYGA